MAAGDYKGRLALGGNRIGKSDQGAYECVLAVTGRHPCRKFPKNSSGWVVGLDYNMVRDVNLPKFDKFLPRNFTIDSDFNKADKIWHIRGDGRECKVQFKSTDSGRAKFQGDSVDWIWFDEEPLKSDIWTECMRALIDKMGIWWMTATPVLGTAWLKALSEQEGVFVTTGAMWDNPYLPIKEIEKQAADLSEEEALVRIEGQYVVFGGSPVFNIRLLTRMINRLKDDIPISQGFIESHAA
jgi:phage terminase large subunit-like protein